MEDVVVASAARSAIGAFGGALKDVPPYRHILAEGLRAGAMSC